MIPHDDFEEIVKLFEAFKLNGKYHCTLVISPIGDPGNIGDGLVISSAEDEVMRENLVRILDQMEAPPDPKDMN